jgi:hypothetical protein
MIKTSAKIRSMFTQFSIIHRTLEWRPFKYIVWLIQMSKTTPKWDAGAGFRRGTCWRGTSIRWRGGGSVPCREDTIGILTLCIWPNVRGTYWVNWEGQSSDRFSNKRSLKLKAARDGLHLCSTRGGCARNVEVDVVSRAAVVPRAPRGRRRGPAWELVLWVPHNMRARRTRTAGSGREHPTAQLPTQTSHWKVTSQRVLVVRQGGERLRLVGAWLVDYEVAAGKAGPDRSCRRGTAVGLTQRASNGTGSFKPLSISHPDRSTNRLMVVDICRTTRI